MSHIEFMKFCQNHWSLTCTPTYPLCGNPDYTVELGNTERWGRGGGGEGNKEQKSLKVLQPVSTLLLKFLMILEFVFNLKRLNFNSMF